MNEAQKQDTIKRFLTKASHYKVLPELIKNSPCDHNAKVCVKAGYVRLKASTKAGNTYVITAKGVKFILEKLSPEKSRKSRISELIKI
jgi:hypothetical protein